MSKRPKLVAPFPYYGGKSRVADIVWSYLGKDVSLYVEPFFGSGAVLLARPDYDIRYNEIVGDKDGFVCNVWRALQFNPDEVARWCDWPVSHLDLTSRKRFILKKEKTLIQNLLNDPEWYDAKIAGYWIWLVSVSIECNAMSSTRLNAVPKLLHSGVAKMSLRSNEIKNKKLYKYFNQLSKRLRNVDVIYGDWKKSLGNSNRQNYFSTIGIFFDPPYGTRSRQKNIYRQDSLDVATEVKNYSIEMGKNKNVRICIAGYDDEHMDLIELGWKCIRWTTSGGMGNIRRVTKNVNRFKECLWFSPHCLNPNQIKKTSIL